MFSEILGTRNRTPFNVLMMGKEMEMQLADLIEARMIEKHKENPLIPIDVLLISVISSSDELRQQVYSTSFFIYILEKLQETFYGEKYFGMRKRMNATENPSIDIHYQAEDIAASHLNVKQKGALVNVELVNSLRDKVNRTKNLQEKLQYQTDLTYCLASLNGRPFFSSVTYQYRFSILQEIYLLLLVGNYEKASSKFGLFRAS